MNSIDLAVQNFLISVRTPALTNLMLFLTKFFDVTSVTSAVRFSVIALCVLILIYAAKGLRPSIMFVTALITGAAVSFFLKSAFNVSRPTDGIFYEIGRSFPSYHAMQAVIFFGMIMYIFDDRLPTWWKSLINIICIILVILVSFSRLYLGVHWLSDVVGGLILGVVIIYLVVKLFKKNDKSFRTRSQRVSGGKA
jgi:membrane-associated phospholipid phosphatase